MRTQSTRSKIDLNKHIFEYAIKNGWIFSVADEKRLYTEPCVITQKGLDYALSTGYKARFVTLCSKEGDVHQIVL